MMKKQIIAAEKTFRKPKTRPYQKFPKMSSGDYWWGRGDLNPQTNVDIT